ncbi:NAD(P)/FAD-dependent oxidoreductase, partial [Limosilactobacillus fermentum]
GVNPSQIKIEVVEASTRLLPMFSEKLANYGVNVVKGLGVELVTGARIQKVEPDKITYTMGKDEEETTGTTTGKTIIWTTGVSGSPIVQADEALKARRGRSIPTDHLTVEGHDDAYIIGDVAAVMPPEGGRPYPTTAQIALGMGKYVAEDLANRIKNGSQLAKPFVYKSLGTVASVGNTRAFGEAMGHEYRGYVASALKKMIANESLYRVGGAGQVLRNGRFDLYH